MSIFICLCLVNSVRSEWSYPESRNLVQVQDGVDSERNFQVVIELEEPRFDGHFQTVAHVAVVAYCDEINPLA